MSRTCYYWFGLSKLRNQEIRIMDLDYQIEIDSSNQFEIDQWSKWSEVAESMDEFYDFDAEPWNQWIDQNEDWRGEFLNVDWRDQYQDFVNFDLLDRTRLTFYRIPRI